MTPRADEPRWEHLGLERFPRATTLTITADCGGSNGNRTRLWKTELQRLADHTQLEIRVCQLPATSGTTADSSSTQHIATLVVAPSVPDGTTVATNFNHYSMLRTTEAMLGIGTYLGGAAGATSMSSGFHL